MPPGDPRPAYTRETVETFARVFTGWNFAGTDEWYSIDMTPHDKLSPKVPLEYYHDRGAKTLLRGEVVEGVFPDLANFAVRDLGPFGGP